MRFKQLAKHLYGGRSETLVLQGSMHSSFSEDGRLAKSLGLTSELSYPRIVLALRKQLKQKRYDVLLGFGPYPSILVWLATRVLSVRPRMLLCETSRPGIVRHMATRPRDRLVRRLIRSAYRSADAVAANSIDGAQECITYYGTDRHRTVRVPNLIDGRQLRVQARKPVTSAWLRHRSRVIVVSRLIRNKGVDTLLQSLASLDSRLDWGLAIAGDGPGRAELESLTAKLRVSERAYFEGWQSNPLPLLAHATVSVCPSTVEGFSNSLLEAMFLDVPVVTSYSTSDTREMCRRGAAAGFEVGDVPGLAAVLSDVLTSTALRSQLVPNAAQYRSAHEIATAILSYEKLILAVAEGGSLPQELTEFSLEGARATGDRSLALGG
jgi:glycosyltransferase involved in cell wall biosynthesis